MKHTNAKYRAWVKTRPCFNCYNYHDPRDPHHVLHGTAKRNIDAIVPVCRRCHSSIHDFGSVELIEEAFKYMLQYIKELQDEK